MRMLFLRWIAVFSDALPDISRIPQRRQIYGGIIASILLHGLLVGLIVLISWLLPDLDQMAVPAKPAPPRQIEVELVSIPSEPPPTPPKILAKAPETLAAIQADGLEESTIAPKKATYQSSQNMVAGSERPGKGSEELPSQAGPDLPFSQFKNQAPVVAKVTDQPEPAPSRPPQTSAPQPAAPSVDQDAPYRIKPLPKEYLEAMARIEQKDPSTEKPAADAIPIKNASPHSPTPAPRPVAAAPVVKPPSPPAPPATREPGFQPELKKSRVEGNISNRGRPGVDAVKTPLGVYRQKLSAQIHSRWQYYIKERMDLIAVGTVRIRFFVTQNGRAEDIEVIESNSNQSFADVCERSVRDAKIPPPPPELEVMKDSRLEMVFGFTLY